MVRAYGARMKQTVTIVCKSKKEAKHVLREALKARDVFRFLHGKQWTKKQLKELASSGRHPHEYSFIKKKTRINE